MISIPGVCIKSTRGLGSHRFFKLLAFLAIVFICTAIFKQNFNIFIPPLRKVLNYDLSCGWNIRLHTRKVTVLIYYLFAGWTCVWLLTISSMVRLTSISPFVPLCHVIYPEKPSEGIATAVFRSGAGWGLGPMDAAAGRDSGRCVRPRSCANSCPRRPSLHLPPVLHALQLQCRGRRPGPFLRSFFPFWCGIVELQASFLCSLTLFQELECYRLMLEEAAWQGRKYTLVALIKSRISL